MVLTAIAYDICVGAWREDLTAVAIISAVPAEVALLGGKDHFAPPVENEDLEIFICDELRDYSEAVIFFYAASRPERIRCADNRITIFRHLDVSGIRTS